MNSKDLAQLAVTAVKQYVSDAVNGVSSRIALIEQKVAEFKDFDPNPLKEEVKTLVKSEVESTVKEAVSLIPVPKDGLDGKDGENGTSVALEDVLTDMLPQVQRYAKELVEAIPLPKDGIDGKDGLDGNPGEKGEKGDSVTIDQVMQFASPLILEEVQARFAEIPLPKDGENGKDGRDGVDGKDGKDGASVVLEDVTPFIAEAVSKAVAEIPAPKDGKDGLNGKDGENGTSVTIEDVFPLIESSVSEAVSKAVTKAVSDIPVPQDGKNGENGLDGKDGVTLEEILPHVTQEVSKAVSAIPIPKDGEKGEKGDSGKDGLNGRDGRDGEDGRDGLDIDILPAIDPKKKYARGTFASHNGGLWRAFKSTNQMEGWECIVDGLSEIEIDVEGRSVSIKMVKSSGSIIEKNAEIPGPDYQGIFKDGSYKKGDMVSFGGNLYIAKEATSEKPTVDSEVWAVAAKRGRDGASAYKVAVNNGFKGSEKEWIASLRGTQGPKGEKGRDLTQMLPDGSKY